MLLIDELKNEHQTIISILEDASKSYSYKNGFSESLQKLIIVKEILISHIKKENTILYPILTKESENNYKLKIHLNLFEKDMKEVSELAFSFFEKYKDTISKDFSYDFAKLSYRLKHRIGREEKVLYSYYKSIKRI